MFDFFRQRLQAVGSLMKDEGLFVKERDILPPFMTFRFGTVATDSRYIHGSTRFPKHYIGSTRFPKHYYYKADST